MADIRKSGAKCFIKSCGRSKRMDLSCRLFSFPPRSSPYFPIWLEKCGLEIKDVPQKKLFLCDKHFEEKCFGNKFLKFHSIPSLNLNIADEQVQPHSSRDFTVPRKTYSGPGGKIAQKKELTIEDIIRMDTDDPTICSEIETSCQKCERNTKNVAFYQRKNNILNKKNKQLLLNAQNNAKEVRLLRRKVKRLKGQVKILQKRNLRNQIDACKISDEAKTLAKMITKDKKVWHEKEKTIAQSIQYKSNATYELLREKFKLNLPSKSSILRWAPIKHLRPGFNEVLFEKIKDYTANMSSTSKEAILIFDDISIRKDLKYNEVFDEIVGFVDFGNHREPKLAKQICLFMIRGLTEDWKFVLSYFAIETSIKGNQLAEILLKNIDTATELGFNIRAVTCDQASNNRNCFKELNVSASKPFFYHNNSKIFCLYDAPHLLKSFRNTLLKYDIETPDGRASWDVVKELHSIEKNLTAKMSLKVTKKHIEPNTFEKMSVKLAVQVFSRTCSAAITTLAKMDKFSNKNTSDTAIPTAEFLLKMNDLFDTLNSKFENYIDNFKSPLKVDSRSLKYLREIVPYLNNLKVNSGKTTIYCIEGMKQTVIGIILLSEDLFKRGFKNVLTALCNQDPDENIFFQIRAKGGNNINPSLYEFNYLIAKIMSVKLIHGVTSSNCEPDELNFLINWNETMGKFEELGSPRTENITESSENAAEKGEIFQFCSLEQQNEYVEMDILPLHSDDRDVQSSSMRYLTGFIIHKFLAKVNCETCSNYMINKSEELLCPSEYFIEFKTFTSCKLKNPSEEFFEICRFHIYIFSEFLKTNKNAREIKKRIFEMCIEKTKCNENYNNYFENDCVQEHREKFLISLLLCLIRKNASMILEKEKNESKARAVKTKNRRINILQS